MVDSSECFLALEFSVKFYCHTVLLCPKNVPYCLTALYTKGNKGCSPLSRMFDDLQGLRRSGKFPGTLLNWASPEEKRANTFS